MKPSKFLVVTVSMLYFQVVVEKDITIKIQNWVEILFIHINNLLRVYSMNIRNS